jgi:Holliday junction resolvase
MKSLGLEPTPNSGSGPIWKEDGQSEDVICQLKSTDAQSIRINKSDIDTLIYNAAVAHKLPVFAIQFLQSSEVYLLVRPEELCEAANYIKTGKYTTANEFVGIDLSEHENMTTSKSKVIKSSSKAREEFKRETEKRFKKEKRSAT